MPRSKPLSVGGSGRARSDTLGRGFLSGGVMEEFLMASVSSCLAVAVAVEVGGCFEL